MTDASNQQIVGDELNEVRSQLQNALGQSLAGLPTDRRIADEDGFSYAQPVQDPYGKAIRYLEKHNIMQLFQRLTANIVFNKPDDPVEYMISEIEDIKQEQCANSKKPE